MAEPGPRVFSPRDRAYIGNLIPRYVTLAKATQEGDGDFVGRVKNQIGLYRKMMIDAGVDGANAYDIDEEARRQASRLPPEEIIRT